MFKKVLIANRGEIACRVIQTLRNMGISSIAVYSAADENACHVKMADEACYIGEAESRLSYLNIPRIIEAAKQCQADAIHPGYGFLSENPAFVEACENAGITFIGPTLPAIKAMASKKLAKQLLEGRNVPLTPGYHGDNQEEAFLLEQAKGIGFPVLLKAASGGGRKGMRIVEQAEKFDSALLSAKREALASFADDTMIIEKYIRNPRHIEIQIMADSLGNVVHLFERDCSIQRRHQKIIEEAPAPGLSAPLREQLAQAAIEVAKAIDYLGAGTVEFLTGDDGQFYFMEMNTRLQVEHPVTEMITGFDLVEWQLLIASGAALPCRQEDIQAKGHAVECRIYAEDPSQNFMPSIGRIDYLHLPLGQGIRIDSGIAEGSVISKYYDPMIAKLICHGKSRQEALARMNQALNNFAIHGLSSNIPFLKAICENPRFIAASLSTGFLNEEQLELSQFPVEKGLLFCTAMRYAKLLENATDKIIQNCFGWHTHLSRKWHWPYQLKQQPLATAVEAVNSDEFILHWNGQQQKCRFKVNKDRVELWLDEQYMKALVIQRNQQISVYCEGQQLNFELMSWQNSDQKTSQQKGQLTSPMPATVVAVLKKAGDKVKAGEQLIVLEAMKMEHSINAPSDGLLSELFYSVGSQVNEGDELLRLEEL